MLESIPYYQKWCICVGTATGRAILGGWGFSTDDVSEVRDVLYEMAQSFEEDDGI